MLHIIGDNNGDVNMNGIDVAELKESSIENSGNIIAHVNSDATINGIVVRGAKQSYV